MNQSSLKGGPPHVDPVDTRRPYGANRYYVVSPKAARRIIIFGVKALRCWIELEADPGINQLCERPVAIPDSSRPKTADFWVSGPSLNEYILLEGLKSTGTRSQPKELPYAAFRAWANEVGCTVRDYAINDRTDRGEFWYGNWVQVLQYVSAFNPYLKPDDFRTVMELVVNRVTVEDVLKVYGQGKEELIRAAIFNLVHRGIFRFVDIGMERLSDLIEIEPA
jgi:hypothetical protein